MVERGVRRSSKRSRMRIERSLGTKRTIEGENRILEWFVEERGRRGKESGVEME